MTKTQKLKWRLSKLPTSGEVIELVNHKLITNEEAKEILFNLEEENSPDSESLKEEIKFLRKLTEKLSDRNKIVEIIKYIEKPYYNYPWYRPYEVWCNVGNYSLTYQPTSISLAGLSDVVTTSTATTDGTSSLLVSSTSDFSDIKTF